MTAPIDRMPRLGRTDALIVAALSVCWLVALSVSGALTPDYWLIDDHEIVRLAAEVRSDGFAATAWRWIVNDLREYSRFRPFYYFHRACEAAALGTSFLAWSAYTVSLGALSASCFYCALKLLGFSTGEAVAFAVFSLVGEHSAIWWRRGPQETLGTALLSIALLAVAWRARSSSRPARALFLGSTVLMSLSKESFILLVPAVVFALVWAVRSVRLISWWEAARTCSLDAALALATMGAELLVVKQRSAPEIAGASAATDMVRKAWDTASALLEYGNLWWVAVPLCAAAVLAGRLDGLRRLVPAATLVALVVAPQALVYARTGVFERYYVPGILGTVFFLAWSMRAAREQVRTAGALRVVCVVSTAAALLAIGYQRAAVTYADARTFGDRVRADQRFLDLLEAPSCGRPVLIAGGLFGVYEAFWSIHFYLEHKAGRGEEYFHFVAPDEPLNGFDSSLVARYQSLPFLRKFDAEGRPEPPPCVGILAGDEEAFLKNASWFDPAAHARHAANRYVVYAKR